MSNISDLTGKIAEFTDGAISLNIASKEGKYSILIGPSRVDGVFNMQSTKSANPSPQKMGVIPSQAKEHILLALEIVQISTYSGAPQFVTLMMPMFPTLSIPVSEIKTAIPVIKKMLDRYF